MINVRFPILYKHLIKIPFANKLIRQDFKKGDFVIKEYNTYRLEYGDRYLCTIYEHEKLHGVVVDIDPPSFPERVEYIIYVKYIEEEKTTTGHYISSIASSPCSKTFRLATKKEIKKEFSQISLEEHIKKYQSTKRSILYYEKPCIL